jgi:surfactin synthase thioesterase subunit
MSSNIKRQPNPLVAEPRPRRQARIRLFCFPYAGGSSLIYRNWPTNLSEEVEVYLLELPGRGNRIREPAHTRLDALVQDIFKVIIPYLSKPFAFFGHSMGALVGFELSRYLRRVQAPVPAQLFVSGRSAPQIVDADPPTYDLPEAEFIQAVRSLNGTPREVLEHPELMSLMIPLLRADFSVCQTYSYTVEPPLDCPITALGGLQDNEVARENLEAWREHTTSDFKLRMLPGDHFFLNSCQAQLLRIVSQGLHQLVRTERFQINA